MSEDKLITPWERYAVVYLWLEDEGDPAEWRPYVAAFETNGRREYAPATFQYQKDAEALAASIREAGNKAKVIKATISFKP